MEKKLKKLAEALDERRAIMEGFKNPADRTYYEGMLNTLHYLGYYAEVDDEGHHKIFEI